MVETRGKMIECICVNPKCKAKFMARIADRKRGWAKCCCKSCAATMTNKKTGNYQRFCDIKNGILKPKYKIIKTKVCAAQYMLDWKSRGEDEYDPMPGEDECDW